MLLYCNTRRPLATAFTTQTVDEKLSISLSQQPLLLTLATTWQNDTIRERDFGLEKAMKKLQDEKTELEGANRVLEKDNEAKDRKCEELALQVP